MGIWKLMRENLRVDRFGWMNLAKACRPAGVYLREGTAAAICLLAGIPYLTVMGCTKKEHEERPMPRSDVRAEFSFDGGQKHIFLPVVADGKSFRFVLDTGCGPIICGESVKSALGKFKGRSKLWSIDAFQFEADLYEAPEEFRVGPIRIRGLVAYVDDFRAHEFVDCDGLLGMDVLQHFILQIDLARSKVVFLDKETKHGDGWGHKIDLDLRNGGVPFISSKIYETNVDFMVDTGLPDIGYLSGDVFRAICSQRHLDLLPGEMIPVSESKPRVQVNAIAPTVSIGPLEYQNLLFCQRESCVLGMDFLRLHEKITFDFQGRCMYLLPRTVGQIVMNEIGMRIHKGGSDLILYVMGDASPAYRAGVRSNDVLLTIDEKDVTTCGLHEIAALLKQRPGNGLRLGVKRGEQAEELTFRISPSSE